MTADDSLKANKPDATVEVVAHDPSWGAQFESEAQQVREVLVNLTPTVEHIGSTSVPGLPAKPTIDILVLVDDARALLRHRESLAALRNSQDLWIGFFR